MKYKDCPAYDKNTETIKKEIGSARGEILYKESEIILSERCSVTGKTDDFDCTNCALYKAFLSGNKNKS